MTKDQIIESLYTIMCTATSSVSDARVSNNDYFKRRVLGFRAEMEFENLISTSKQKLLFLEGGQFISKKIDGSKVDKNSFIYVTISMDDPKEYLTLYKTIASWRQVNKLFFLRVKASSDWKTEKLLTKIHSGAIPAEKSILVPDMEFYIYDLNKNEFTETNKYFDEILKIFPEPQRRPSIFPLRKREQFNYFNEYDISALIKIYANRYFLDVIMRNAPGRQIIDLDGFVAQESDLTTLTLVEIKEKTPIINSKDQNDWRYGWDSRRILWYLYILKNLDLNCLYCVRQINNREERRFVQWDTINLEEFLRGISWSSSRSGGGGEDTLLAPYSYFQPFEENFR